MYIGSNEGFPSVNNNMRGTKDVPVLLKILKVLRNRKGEIRGSIKQGISSAVQHVEQGKVLVGVLEAHCVFALHLCTL